MSEEQNPVYQRLNFIVAQLEAGNQADFARRIGVRSGVVGDMFGKRKNKPSFDVLAKIASAYPQLRVEWLLLGTGEMLKKSTVAPDVEKPQNISSYYPASPAGLPLAPYPAPAGAGTNSLSAGLRVTDSDGSPGTLPSFNLAPKPALKKHKPGADTATATAEPTTLPGTDLLQLVASHEKAIQALRSHFESLGDYVQTLHQEMLIHMHQAKAPQGK